MILIDEHENELYKSVLVNTDHTIHYRGGILLEGLYHAIMGTRSTGKRVIKLFSRNTKISRIKSDKDIQEVDYVLPSKIPNPNHNRKMIISYVQIHGGGLSWDYSHGCITLPNCLGYHEFDRLLEHLITNEIVEVNLR